MELELHYDSVNCYDIIFDGALCQEETQEAIVPDACPDILRIVDVCAQAFASRWEAREGQAAVTGIIQAAILYMPESGTELAHMDVRMPFTAQADMPELESGAILEVCTRLRKADARILNPRKILLRCDLIAEVSALQKKELSVCSGVRNSDPERICQKQKQVEYERLVSAPQRIFPMSEEIRLTGTQAPVLLASRSGAVCTENRVIGNKIIFKGKTDVELLLQTADGAVERKTESFPFSQILEARGAGESGSSSVQLEISEFSCVQPLDDPFRLLVEAEVLAMGQVRERETATLLTDLYSTTHHTQLEKRTLRLSAPCEWNVFPQTLRDLLETGDVVRSVCDSRFELGHILHTQEEDTLTLTAQGIISVLYLDENRQPRCVKKDIEITTRASAPAGSGIFYRCICPGELFAAPCAGGIEVRLSLEFHTLCCAFRTFDLVCQVSVGEARSSDTLRPSVILRLPEAGESLWDIAKACGTTKERIMQANELSGEDIPRQKMLLIPSAR